MHCTVFPSFVGFLIVGAQAVVVAVVVVAAAAVVKKVVNVLCT